MDDIDFIAEYIARDSIDRAALFVLRLTEAVDRLLEFPLSGRIIPEINDTNCREIIYRSYRIMYKVSNDDVWITGIVHSARNWNPQN